MKEISTRSISPRKISRFMLERYRLNELSSEEMKIVEEAILSDSELRARLQELDASDKEILLQYPRLDLNIKKMPSRRITGSFKTRVVLAAAAAILIVSIPFIIFTRGNNSSTAIASVPLVEGAADRPKGQVPAGSELFIYLKGNADAPLEARSVLEEGNTVQLAYIAPAGKEHYGMIFSIDGRSVITTHYPYRLGQSSLLVSGKHTLLNEAYTLDDAPDYEVFVFVVSQDPIDARAVLAVAQIIADNLSIDNLSYSLSNEGLSKVFYGCEVETVIVKKR